MFVTGGAKWWLAVQSIHSWPGGRGFGGFQCQSQSIHRLVTCHMGHSLKSLLMGFIFSLEDKSNEWSTEDKLNVLSTAVSYASPSQGFHSLFGSFIEESFDGFHFLFRRQIEAITQ